mmetsp:Transcript_23927/g.39339  ORF Transcript_23927/g.39339 Transcript_23927/m.39339 type:complete len:80 (-) Transcript_23927:414-653(-)
MRRPAASVSCFTTTTPPPGYTPLIKRLLPLNMCNPNPDLLCSFPYIIISSKDFPITDINLCRHFQSPPQLTVASLTLPV